jgi:hypothetical protein
MDNLDGRMIVDYAPYPVQAKKPRWPVLIGTAVDDRFAHGVAINDIIVSATELDIAAVAQGGLFRVYDYLGRNWSQYSFDLDVTVDTAPIATNVDDDPEVEILLGTNRVTSDENPIFANQNAIIVIDSLFRSRYEQLISQVAGQVLSQTAIVDLIAQNDLANAFYFLPPGHATFPSPAVRDVDGDGKPEVVIVTRPTATGGSSLIQIVSFKSAKDEPPVLEKSIEVLVNATTVKLASVLPGQTVTINGLMFTAHASQTTPSKREFSIVGSDVQDAAALLGLIRDTAVGVPGIFAAITNGGAEIALTIADERGIPLTVSSSSATMLPISTSPVGAGSLGEPSAGHLLPGDVKLAQIAVGSQSGKVFVIDPNTAVSGVFTPVITLAGPTLRAPALADVDGDGLEEILMAIAERDRSSFARTELHFFEASGAPVAPLTSTLIYKPSLEYDSLSTPAVGRLFPPSAAPKRITLTGVTPPASITINGLTFTALAAASSVPASRQFATAGTDTQDAKALADLINHTTYGVPGVAAHASGPVVFLAATSAGIKVTNPGVGFDVQEANDWVAFFATRNTFVGMDLHPTLNPQTGKFETAKLFELIPNGTNFAFGSSSPVVGQTDPEHSSFEIVLGGGRDTHGNLFGWYFNFLSMTSGQLLPAAGFAAHEEPRFPGNFFAPSILGSPEMADLDGNLLTDVIYTNEGGFIHRFESPEGAEFATSFEPSDFPWPSFKHDQARTGSASGRAVPIQPFLPGDVNRDGVVDENDLFLVSKSWGLAEPLILHSGALDPAGQADDEMEMTPQGFLLRMISDMKR